jgi:hypothetical protein
VKAVAAHESDVARTAMMKHVSGYDEYRSSQTQLTTRR